MLSRASPRRRVARGRDGDTGSKWRTQLKAAPRVLSLLARSVILATFYWILIAASRALPDRFGWSRVEQDLVGKKFWRTRVA